MKEERLSILHAFWGGGVFFAFSQVFAAWIVAQAETAIVVTIFVIISFEVIRRSMTRISRKFKFENIFAKVDEAMHGTNRSGNRRSVKGEEFLRKKEADVEKAKILQANMRSALGVRSGAGGVAV